MCDRLCMCSVYCIFKPDNILLVSGLSTMHIAKFKLLSTFQHPGFLQKIMINDITLHMVCHLDAMGHFVSNAVYDPRL